MQQSHFDLVCEFHQKFGVPVRIVPQFLAPDEHMFRSNFLAEEMEEYNTAFDNEDLTKQIDALLDLIYVAYGTLALHGVDANLAMAIVHDANMKKVRAPSAEASAEASGRGHSLDVIKPEGWTPPEPKLDLLLSLLTIHTRDDYVRRRAIEQNFRPLLPGYFPPEIKSAR